MINDNLFYDLQKDGKNKIFHKRCSFCYQSQFTIHWRMKKCQKNKIIEKIKYIVIKYNMIDI